MAETRKRIDNECLICHGPVHPDREFCLCSEACYNAVRFGSGFGFEERRVNAGIPLWKPPVPLYSIATMDPEVSAYTPQEGVPSFNLTLWQLKDSMRMLRELGYSCHRIRDEDGVHRHENDVYVLIERTDGASEEDILARWER